ncbi:SUMF1/EgtB/PvdO family nonheme iron enzyme [Candidatus Poribacteria bacterium]
MESPTVFISYSRESQKHDDRVLALSDKLRQDGIDCTIDQYEVAPPEGLAKWMDRQIENSDFILVVCTETYHRRVMGEEERGKGQGVKWESTLAYQDLYDEDAENTRFIPVLFELDDIKYIPRPLKGTIYYHVDTGYEDLYRRLTNQPRIEKPTLGKPRKLPRRRQVTTTSDADERVVIERPKIVTIVGKDGAEMALIPAGNFRMGSDDGEDDEKPVHTVYVDAFYMDKYPVTNTQYRRFVQATGHSEPRSLGGFRPWSNLKFSGDDQPVVCVSWNDAQAYAQWAGKRLPTEAEWEKAARGGLMDMKYPWGNEIKDENANYGVNVKHTTPVSSYPPNDYGLYDMAGNIWEWCADWYGENYYLDSPSLDPEGPGSGVLRVLRGGSWNHSRPSNLRVSYRSPGTPDILSNHVGFRCAELLVTP